MTPEKKVYDKIRNGLIAQDGEKFLMLSEKDQNNIILAYWRGHIEQLKQGGKL